MSKRTCLLALCIGYWGAVFAQLDPSNIYLFEMVPTSDTSFAFNNPKYLTYFNANGYNNQPAFIDDNRIYISVQVPGEPQPDLYELDLKAETKIKVTETVEGEFSPELMPTRYQFSAIRQEVGDRDTVLRLWEFPLDRLSNGKPIFKYLNKIGYYHWINSTKVAVYIVANPSELVIADTRSDQLEPIATNVGRCFKRLRNGNLAYIQKSDYQNWAIMEQKISYSGLVDDQEPVKVIETLPGSEDFEILPDGTFLMALGSKLFKFNKYRDDDWVEIADFRYFGLRNITRMALSRDSKLAVVAN